MAGLPEYDFDEFKIPSAELPGKPTDLKKVLKTQIQNAEDYQTKVPEYRTNAFNQADRSIRSDLASGIRNTNQNYNSRGLLNSGKRQTDIGSLNNSANASLDAAKQGINQQLFDTGNNLQNSAVNTGYQMAGLAPALTQGILGPQQVANQNDISNMQFQSQLATGLGQGIGSGYATSLAKKNYGSPLSNSIYSQNYGSGGGPNLGVNYNMGQYSNPYGP